MREAHGPSVETVETYCAAVMRKLDVRPVVESCDALCATGSQRCSENNARSLTGLGFQVVAIAVSAVEMKIGDNRG